MLFSDLDCVEEINKFVQCMIIIDYGRDTASYWNYTELPVHDWV